MRCKKKPSDRARSHHRTRGGDLLLCFTSRRSASAAASSSATAMRVPSTKSLPSPGRSRDASAAAAPSLSSSLSRRLRNSGSVKGGQSPMFPAVVGGRRKGVAFEAAEPTSPKVTCIGQVRVKSKKKKAAAAAAAAAAAKSKASVMRSRSVRGSGREASFRRVEDFGGGRECLPSRNNKWMHQLPVSICEALRAFGSEFNCFSPCGGRSFCFSSSSSRSVEGKGGVCGEKRSGSCGAGFARWLMAVPDGEEGKRPGAIGVVVENRRDREMEMVINQKVKGEDLDLGIEMEKGEEVVMVVEKGEEKEEDEARVSICIPPRNALLLMRCRSDPVRMAALTSRFWDSPAMKVRVEEGREEEEEEDDGDVNIDRCAESNTNVEAEERSKEAAETKQLYEEEGAAEESLDASVLTEELMTSSDGLERKEEVVPLIPGEEMQNEEENLKEGASAPVDENANAGDEQELKETAAAEADDAHSGEKPEEKEMTDEVDLQDREDDKEVDKGTRSSSCASTVDKQERTHRYVSRSKDGGRRRSLSSRERDRRHSFSTEREARRPSFGSEKEVRRASFSMEGKGRWSFSIEKDGLRIEKEATYEQKRSKEQCLPEEKELKDIIKVQNSQGTEKGVGREEDDYNTEECQVEREAAQKRAEENKSTELPDCLLLMMYEPKLSMEVSKETWVCSTDFLQWQLHHPNRPRHPPKSTAAATITTTTDTSIDGTSLDAVAGDEASEITNDMSSENKAVVAPIQEPSQPSPTPPPAPPTASETEKKIKSNDAVLPTPVSASAYAPFMLTRCKSEPMRSSVRLTPDACFWKDRHRPVGASRFGF